MSLSSQIFIGLGLGILTGVFFGELVADWKLVGDLYVQFLQVTVLPYIVVSLIAGFAKLSMQQVNMLAVRGGLILVGIWVVTLISIYLCSWAFPDTGIEAFFASPQTDAREEVDLFELFVPANVFYSLSNSMVPAVVVFSLLMGIALISVADKAVVIRIFDALSEALTKINEFVVKATPIGIFFISASAAGTLTIDELSRVQVYLVTYIVFALIVTFWIFPALIAALSGIPYKEILHTFKDALVTAFATGNQFVVLPLIAENSKQLLSRYHGKSDTSDSAIDVIVPISFNFPSLGKLLVILFVMFAAWFNSIEVSAIDYAVVAVSGLFSLFGSIHVAVPYMLDMLRVPADMYQLFLVTGVVVGRFGAMLAALHIICIGLLGTLALTGRIKLSLSAIGGYAAVSGAVLLVMVVLLRGYFSMFTPDSPDRQVALANITLLENRVPTTVHVEPQGDLSEGLATPSSIRDRGVLKVGYRPQNLPCTFLVEGDQLVGFDVEFSQLLAEDLGVAIEYVPFELETMGESLDSGEIDIALSCLASLPDRYFQASFTQPYLMLHLGWVVKDYDRNRFGDADSIAKLDTFTVASVSTHYFEARLERLFPNANAIVLGSAIDFFTTEHDADALLLSVEEGSAYAYRYPEYTVVPSARATTIPAGIAVARGNVELTEFLNNWILLKQGEGTVDALQDYWMRGGVTRDTTERWSIVKDVLQWDL